MARHHQLTEMLKALQSRALRATSKHARQSIRRIIATLEAELKSLDTDINKTIRVSFAWLVRVDLPQSVPGVGPTTARTLLAERPEIGSLTRREIAALAP